MAQTPDETNTQPEDVGTGADARAEDGSVEELPAGADARVAELEARLRTVSAAYRQKAEEIESVKRRLEERAAMQEEIRRGEVVGLLFEPVENLLRSVEAARGTPAEQGLRMVYQQFMTSLHKLGLEEVPGSGAAFDPSLHEAIATQPVEDAADDGKVLSVYSAGYRIGKRLIRPARVVIGNYAAPAGEA